MYQISFLSSTPVLKSVKDNRNLLDSHLAMWHYFGKLEHYTEKTEAEEQNRGTRELINEVEQKIEDLSSSVITTSLFRIMKYYKENGYHIYHLFQ